MSDGSDNEALGRSSQAGVLASEGEGLECDKGCEPPGGAGWKSSLISDTAKRIAGRLRDQRSVSPFFGHKERCFDTCFSPCGTLLASASEDSTVRIWDPDSCCTVLTLRHESEVLRVAFSDSPKSTSNQLLLASASAAGNVRIWDVTTDEGAHPRTRKSQDGRVARVRASLITELPHGLGQQVYACKFIGGNSLLTASDDCVHFWDLETRVKTNMWRYEQLPGHPGVFGGDARNPQGQVWVFDVEAGMVGGGRDVVCVALSDGSVRVQDRRSSAAVATLCRTAAGHLTGLRLSGDAGVLVSCGGKGEATVWDTRKWAIRTTLRGHRGPVYGAAFMDGKRWQGQNAAAVPLLTWSSDGRLNLWDVSEASDDLVPEQTLTYNDFAVYSAALSPSGDMLACAGGASATPCGGHVPPRTLFVHRL